MATDDVTLDALRQRVTDIDRQLITLVAERKRVSGEVARVKRATGYPTRDFERERDVILGVRTIATELGVSPDAGRGPAQVAYPLLAYDARAGKRSRERYWLWSPRARDRRRRQKWVAGS